MTKTVYSHVLQKDVVLDGEDLRFYEAFSGKNSHFWRQGSDPAYALGLEKLGYTFAKDRDLFNDHGYRVKAYAVLENKIPVEVAHNAYHLLRDDGNRVKPGTWLSEALSVLTPDGLIKAETLRRAGWKETFAYIIAAFPQREARLQEAIDHGIEFYEIFFDTPYDLAMIERLLEVPGAYHLALKKNLDKGFTEEEIKGFGYNVTSFYTVEEVRSVSIKPSFFKNIASAFDLHNWTPEVSEIEAVFVSGIKNGKQYKQYAKALGMKPAEKETLEEVVTASNIIPLADVLKISEKTGPLNLTDIESISLILEDGYTIEECVNILDAADPALEAKSRRAGSLTVAACNALIKGLSANEVAALSKAGTPLMAM